MNGLINRLSLWLSRHRSLQRWCKPLLPNTARFPVLDELQLEIPLQDQTGPAFYLNYGGSAAFYHYEQVEKLELLRCMPEDGVLLDIGANIGLFSFYLTQMLPQLRCVAFEPHPTLSQCLRKSVSYNPKHQIQVEELCLGNTQGSVELITHQKNWGGGSLLPELIERKDQSQKLAVQSMTLDLWWRGQSLDRLDAVKIDVQGAEALVLEGAQETIRKFQPSLLIEIENQALLKDTAWRNLLESDLFSGYLVRRVGTFRFEPVSQLPHFASEELSLGRRQTNYFLSSPACSSKNT